MSTSFRPPLPPIVSARFLQRPNRFLVIGQLKNKQQVRAFLPNPGRLQELLLPDTTLYLVPADGNAERKTTHTVIGVAGPSHPIFLHTHVNNAVARHLLETRQVPGFKQAKILRAEAPLGSSRFDFLLEQRGKPVYLEVKSCTLFGNRGAMFPDAITERGRRHLEELAMLSREGTRTAVLFVVHSNEVDWFMPDYHTDPDFSQTLLNVRKEVQIIPLAIGWERDFSLTPGVRRLPIPWAHVARELGDRGNYLVLLRGQTAHAGNAQEPGFYLAVGWCQSTLRRFLRRIGNTLHTPNETHRPNSGLAILETYPIVGARNRQTEIEASLRRCFRSTTTFVHAGDSELPLFHCDADPRHMHPFHELLAQFRMATPVFQNEKSRSCP